MAGTCAEHAIEGMHLICDSPTFSDSNPDPFVLGHFMMCAEVKTITAQDNVPAETQLAEEHGRFVYLDILAQPQLFKKLVPKSAHRVQCVQHCVALSAYLTLYVVADTGRVGIIRCVLICVPDVFKREYVDIFEVMVSEHLTWVHGIPRTIRPHLSQEQLRYLQSNDVLDFHLFSWLALVEYVSENGPINCNCRSLVQVFR